MIEHQTELVSNSPDETRRLGQTLGEQASAGMVIALAGDLGCGKTVFAQGFARGLGVSERQYVVSPTYTIVNEYMGRLPLFHLDLYRLDDPVDLDQIGLNEMADRKSIIVIEWADKFDRDILPRDIDIHIATTGEQSRRIRMIGYGLEAENLVTRIRIFCSSDNA